MISWIEQLRSSGDSGLISKVYHAIESVIIKKDNKSENQKKAPNDRQELLQQMEENFKLQMKL